MQLLKMQHRVLSTEQNLRRSGAFVFSATQGCHVGGTKTELDPKTVFEHKKQNYQAILKQCSFPRRYAFINVLNGEYYFEYSQK